MQTAGAQPLHQNIDLLQHLLRVIPPTRLARTRTQVTSITSQNETKYRCAFTDGADTIKGAFATQVTPMIKSGELSNGAIVKIQPTSFVCNAFGSEMMLMVTAVELVSRAGLAVAPASPCLRGGRVRGTQILACAGIGRVPTHGKGLSAAQGRGARDDCPSSPPGLCLASSLSYIQAQNK